MIAACLFMIMCNGKALKVELNKYISQMDDSSLKLKTIDYR